MNTRWKSMSWMLALCVFGLNGSQYLQADESPAKEAPLSADQSQTQELNLSVFVDKDSLKAAWMELNATELANITLQLAGAEFVLGRADKEFNAAAVAEIAMKVALENNDAEALRRLGRYAEITSDKKMLQQISVQNKLGGASRGAGPELQVPIDRINREQLHVFQIFRSRIRSAKLIGDQNELNALLEDARTLAIPEAMKKALVEAGKNGQASGLKGNSVLQELMGNSGVAKTDTTGKLDGAVRGKPPVALGYVLNTPGPAAYYSQRLRGQFIHRPNWTIPGYPPFPGVRITALDPNSPLRAIGLKVGDVISRLDNIRVRDLAELEKHYSQSMVTYVRVGRQTAERNWVNLGPANVSRPPFGGPSYGTPRVAPYIQN